MALTKCKVCGNDVDTSSKRCPHCGKYRWTGGRIGCLTVVLIFLVIPIFIAIFNSATNTNNTKETSGTQSSVKVDVPSEQIRKGWEYDQNYDKMRDTTTYFATLESSNKLNFNFPYHGGSSGIITIRKSSELGKDILLIINKGQFKCRYDGCAISAKFDNGKIDKYHVSEPSDGSANALFIKQYSKFLNNLKNSKHVTIEVEFFQEGYRQLEFDVAGLKWEHK